MGKLGELHYTEMAGRAQGLQNVTLKTPRSDSKFSHGTSVAGSVTSTTSSAGTQLAKAGLMKDIFNNILVQSESGDSWGTPRDPPSPSDSPRQRQRATTKHYRELRDDFKKAVVQKPSIQKEELQKAIWKAEKAGIPSSCPDFQTAQALLATLSDPVRHPSRAEILTQDPSSAHWAEGHIARNVAKGCDKLKVALSRYIEDSMLIMGRESLLVLAVWKAVDADNDEQLEHCEARELVRTYLSTPGLGNSIGRELAKEIMEQRQSRFPGSELMTLCRRAVAAACRKLACKVPEVADAIWTAMDTDGDGVVYEHEFVSTFGAVTRQQLWQPIYDIAKESAQELLDADALHAVTADDALDLVRTHRKKQKQDSKRQETIQEQSDKAVVEEASQPCGCAMQ